VNTVPVTLIGNLVPAPGIEDPALSGLHVRLLVRAMKSDQWIRDDRNVDTHARIPMVVKIDVLAYFGPGRQFHETRPPEYFAKACYDLARVRTLSQVWSFLHAAIEVVVIAAPA
jgi:hypothetical protein